MSTIVDEFGEKYYDKITIEWDDGKGGKVKLPYNGGENKKKEYGIDLSDPKIIKISKKYDNWPVSIQVTVSNDQLAINAQGCSNNCSNSNQCDNFKDNNHTCKLDVESITTKGARCNVEKGEDGSWKITPVKKSNTPPSDTDYYVDAFCLKISATNTSLLTNSSPGTVTIGDPPPSKNDNRKKKVNSDGAESVQR